MASPISMCMGTRLCMTKHKSIRAHTAVETATCFVVVVVVVVHQLLCRLPQKTCRVITACVSSFGFVINPFTAPACTIFRVERCTDRGTCKFSGPVTHLLSTLSVLMKVLSRASAKRKTERLKGFKFLTITGRFQVTSWQLM